MKPDSKSEDRLLDKAVYYSLLNRNKNILLLLIVEHNKE